MSFDLFLVRFDGEPLDRDAALAVVRRHHEGAADEHGFYAVELADGSSLELSAQELESDEPFESASFHLHDFTPAVIAFVHDFARASGACLVNAQASGEPGDSSVIVFSRADLATVDEEFAQSPPVCESAEHLATLLGAGIEGWQAFRDKAIGRPDEPTDG